MILYHKIAVNGYNKWTADPTGAGRNGRADKAAAQHVNAEFGDGNFWAEIVR
jgi:hypothetical protein